MLSEILGQPVAVQILRNYIERDQITGSFLFVGPQHVGKSFAARQFAAALLCEAQENGVDACGECVACRLTAGDRHPDLRIARPSGASRILRLPQIWPREGVKEFPAESALLRDLSFGPVRSRRRVFILEDADALNDDTANSLLKVLEEPPAYATFILTAPGSSSVLPTIFSRCQTVRFQSVPAGVTERALIDRNLADAAAARFLAAFSQGQIGTAFTLASERDVRAARETVLDAVDKLCRASHPIEALKLGDDIRKAAAKLAGSSKPAEAGETGTRSSLAGALEIVSSWYRDLLALSCGASETSLINLDRLKFIQELAPRYSQPALRQAIELIVAVEHCVDRNANAQIALEALTLRLASLPTSRLRKAA